MSPSDSLPAFQAVLRSSKHIIAIAGAGLSAASGIPTFRGAGGMWRKYDAMSLATPQAFNKNPSLVWQFYHYRREKVFAATPNAAHYALASFTLPAIREAIAPGSTFTLITQNVDGLSDKALQAVMASAPADTELDQPLIEMHGRLLDVSCTSSECGHVELNAVSPICPALEGTDLQVEAGVLDPDIPVSNLPRCSQCGFLARPGVVWFGEIPLHQPTINRLVDDADLCLVVGTSSTVYPAASYASEVVEHGGKVAVFNLDRSSGDNEADFLFLGPSEETLPRALGTPDQPLVLP
ncbi:hypothetical protein HGRIS_009609 [Hohenbuehelia grisea]|uniref:NAD-dependent protein deacylase n=1 Tax=Hohenbuehelia grisea TaxID=104357 RepID=A0ABR3J268_9AGAR